MSAKLLPNVQSNFRIADHDLEDLMIYSEKFGKMRLVRMGDGWFCSIDMNTNTTGTSFEVKSEFNHATPLVAARTCLDRMHTALEVLGA